MKAKEVMIQEVEKLQACTNSKREEKQVNQNVAVALPPLGSRFSRVYLGGRKGEKRSRAASPTKVDF